MSKGTIRLFRILQKNNRNRIIYYEGKNRITKTYPELYADIHTCIYRLFYLSESTPVSAVGIIGPTSYQWAVIDLACIRGGFMSVAFPEMLSCEEINDLLADTPVDILLIDYALKNKFERVNAKVFFYNCPPGADVQNDLQRVPAREKVLTNDLIQEQYGITYSSGTSSKIKKIKLTLPKDAPGKQSIGVKLMQWYRRIRYELSFWSRKDNRLIIYMPFSHRQQRGFFTIALDQGTDIVLSDPANCLKHIIMEKPNIMIAVPAIYEAMAQRIQTKLARFSPARKKAFLLFNALGINGWGNRNPIKKCFAHALFKDLKSIYGGRADFFVVGSATAKPEMLRLFYSIGVKIYQAYGQSESDNIAMNSSRHFRLGSVGKPMVDMRISEEGEILMRFDEKRHGINREILNLVTLDGKEYICTGDLGYLDGDGYLFLKGRKDEVIVLDNGKKIFPAQLEEKINCISGVDTSVAMSLENRKIALVVSTRRGEPAYYRQEIRKLNQQLPSYQRITHFLLTHERFSPENGLLTATFKIRRGEVARKYKQEVFIPVDN